MGGEEGRRERRDSQEQQCEGSGKKGWEKGRGVRGRKKGKGGIEGDLWWGRITRKELMGRINGRRIGEGKHRPPYNSF